MERSKSNRPTDDRKDLASRVAGAPISWGVCEVPGWGFQLPAERVLSELAGLGLTATEHGPEGFLPEEQAASRALLDRYGLRMIASFVPAVLHQRARREAEMQGVERAAIALAGAGGQVLVLAAATGRDGYETGGPLTDDEWQSLLEGVDRSAQVARRHGLALAVHPHYGTVIEDDTQVDRLLAGSGVDLCLDVGHLAVAGADALAVARRADGRIGHVHLKDVDAAVAGRVRRRELGYHEAVRGGLYRPLGQGASPIRETVSLLEAKGYQGWYVLEQDVVLSSEPAAGAGPMRDVERSLQFLLSLAA